MLYCPKTCRREAEVDSAPPVTRARPKAGSISHTVLDSGMNWRKAELSPTTFIVSTAAGAGGRAISIIVNSLILGYWMGRITADSSHGEKEGSKSERPKKVSRVKSRGQTLGECPSLFAWENVQTWLSGRHFGKYVLATCQTPMCV